MSITAARFSMQFDGTRKTNRNGQRKITFKLIVVATATGASILKF